LPLQDGISAAKSGRDDEKLNLVAVLQRRAAASQRLKVCHNRPVVPVENQIHDADERNPEVLAGRRIDQRCFQARFHGQRARLVGGDDLQIGGQQVAGLLLQCLPITPEPSTFALFGIAAAGLFGRVQRRRKQLIA
jgi:hypothetical protein